MVLHNDVALSVTATLDAAGDGWIDLWVGSALPRTTFSGFHVQSLRSCDVSSEGVLGACEEVSVFGGAGGLAEAARMYVSAGYAFVHGVHGACFGPGCSPLQVGPAPALLTTLSVAVPRISRSHSGFGTRICLEGMRLHPTGGGAALAVTPRTVCEPLRPTPGLGPAGLPNGSLEHRGVARGVAMVKTYKTGSSTLGALLHRYADVRALDVAINAKALRGARALRRHLHPGTLPKPTECLFEFHTFKPCGGDWLKAQPGSTPKPLQLVIDHSRWQPLKELLHGADGALPRRGRQRQRAGGLTSGPACDAFLGRMRATAGAAHKLFVGSSASADLKQCIRGLAARQTAAASAAGSAGGAQRGAGGTGLAAPSAYRESIPGGLLVTIMRWPAGRFTSALEQFSMPQQTGVPCTRNRAQTGGACHGMTCERDFKFTWRCMNRTVDRAGMLAAVVRCLIDRSNPEERAARRLADLEAIGQRPPPSRAAAEAHRALRAKLTTEQAKHASSLTPGRRRLKAPGCEPVDRARRRDIPMTFRYIKEAVANTLGWPLEPTPLSDGYRRMLGDGSMGGGGGSGGPFGGPRLPLDWLASLARSFDLVLIAEHLDASLLLLSRLLGIPSHELIYISQKRRAQDTKKKLVGGQTPVALAAMTAKGLANTSAWPDAEMLLDADGPWLWPSDLDAALRANWLDSLAYMYFNATLWERIEQVWSGPTGQASFVAELATFRATRAAIVASCVGCEGMGSQRCLDEARATPGRPSPHFCWTLRQDTRSWSEHFFKRMALRFDAAAAAREVPHSARARGMDGASAGVRTGNVNWWRCGTTRAVGSQCSKLSRARNSLPQYGLWDCACHW